MLLSYFIKDLVRQINPLKDLSALFSLVRILRKEKPDIVHTHSSKAGILGRWASRFAGVPCIIHTFHGFGFNDFQGSIRKSVFLLAEKLTAGITDRFIFVSRENMKTALENRLGESREHCTSQLGECKKSASTKVIACSFQCAAHKLSTCSHAAGSNPARAGGRAGKMSGCMYQARSKHGRCLVPAC